MSVVTITAILSIIEVSIGAYFTNPIINRDFPDPCILRAASGTFYIYATQGNGHNIQVASSTDACSWNYIGEAMPTKPSWIAHDTWAPHVMEYESGQFFMYFTAFNSENTLCVGVASATNPVGPFRDALSSQPLYCKGNLDPMAFVDPKSNAGNSYLYYGHSSALEVQQLNADHKSFNPNNGEVETLKMNASLPYESLVEASWLHYRNGYYYYFYSGNNCCGTDAHYAVMIARSDQGPFGPFIRRSAANQGFKDDVILQSNDRFYATGHNSLYTDKQGNDWIYYHAYQIGENNARKLLMDRVYYDSNGWPYVNTSSPSYTRQIGPVI